MSKIIVKNAVKRKDGYIYYIDTKGHLCELKMRIRTKINGGKNMVKKLTDKERREREVKDVLSKIKKLEKQHKMDVIKSACYKYTTAIQDRMKAEKDVKEAEKRLADAKRRLK